jgi:hypothetical protein
MIAAMSELPTRQPPTDNEALIPPAACGLTCPVCGTELTRIRRRFIDRLVSAVRPVRRYRCHSFACHWEGNLRCRANATER